MISREGERAREERERGDRRGGEEEKDWGREREGDEWRKQG